jgi:hypothetical protein
VYVVGGLKIYDCDYVGAEWVGFVLAGANWSHVKVDFADDGYIMYP